jgi:hypothetical protein
MDFENIKTLTKLKVGLLILILVINTTSAKAPLSNDSPAILVLLVYYRLQF